MNFTKFYDEIDFDAKSRFISKTKATEGDIRSRGFEELEEIKNRPREIPESKKQQIALFSAVRSIIKRIDDLTEEELEDIINIYPSWNELIGQTILKDKLLRYKGKIYKSLKEHEVKKDFNPVETNYLYTEWNPSEVIPYWKQPEGYEDVYAKGDQVIYKPNGKTYISKIDSNSQEPTKDEPHNRYWEEV